MNVSDIFTELDNYGFEDTDTTARMNAINETLWDIESREPWPFLEKTIALNTNGTSPTPTNMPTDFNKVIWLYDLTQKVSLWPQRLSTIRDSHGFEVGTVGEPTSYYFVGNTLKLFPVPSASTGRFQLDYFATQPALTDTSVEADILLPVRHHWAILLGTLYRLYMKEDDPENAAAFNQSFENRLLIAREDLFRRQYQQSDRIYVIDEDDEAYGGDW